MVSDKTTRRYHHLVKRRLPIVLGIALVVSVIAIAVMWRKCRGAHDALPGAGTASGSSMTIPTLVRKRIDPRTLPRASIAGTIRDERGAAVANARACASFTSRALSPQLTRDPICVAADANGAYRIANLIAATYQVVAMAPHHVPAAYAPGGEPWFALAAGDAKTGVDIVIESGAVEITGTVSDISGGPIVGARVWAQSTTPSEFVTSSDEQGRFSVWLAPGSTTISAVADGYAVTHDKTIAPGTIDLQLIPESSLSGTVVDAITGDPREGVRVEATAPPSGDPFWDEHADLSDATGHFRIARLLPSRYSLEARDAAGYGRSEGSSLVGLGQQVDGVVIKLHRAYRIAGRVQIAKTNQPCPQASIDILVDPGDRIGITGASHTNGDDVVIDGVIPGRYQLDVSCPGHHPDGEPPSVTVTDADLTGLVWTVSPGGKLHGHVRTKAGAPVVDARIAVRPTKLLARGEDGNDTTVTDATGAFTLDGLYAASYGVVASSTGGVTSPEVEVEVHADATTERDIVLDEGGTLRGIVSDTAGRPLPNLTVMAVPANHPSLPDGTITHADGSFEISGVAGGDYRVVAVRRWQAIDLTPDDLGPKVHVDVGRATNVKLVIADDAGRIRGSVVDGDGKPIADAFVQAAREGEAGNATIRAYSGFDDGAVLTQPDGTFVIDKLGSGKYTVRAYRKGGGDALAEHVALDARIQLQIKPTASIEGTVLLDRRAPESFVVIVRATKLGLERREQLFRSSGHYAVRDLPAGAFEVVIEATGGFGSQPVTLAVGEHRTGVDFALEPLATLTGTLVERTTHTPLPGFDMFARRPGSDGQVIALSNLRANVTDTAGRFTIERAPVGAIALLGISHDPAEPWSFELARTIPTTAGSVELGEVSVVRPRTKRGQQRGSLGIRIKDPGDDAVDRVHEVAWIDPKGSAAKTELVVGDQITSVDGTDVTGDNGGLFDLLIDAPAGTPITLGLARGSSVKIVLTLPPR